GQRACNKLVRSVAVGEPAVILGIGPAAGYQFACAAVDSKRPKTGQSAFAAYAGDDQRIIAAAINRIPCPDKLRLLESRRPLAAVVQGIPGGKQPRLRKPVLRVGASDNLEFHSTACRAFIHSLPVEPSRESKN